MVGPACFWASPAGVLAIITGSAVAGEWGGLFTASLNVQVPRTTPSLSLISCAEPSITPSVLFTFIIPWACSFASSASAACSGRNILLFYNLVCLQYDQKPVLLVFFFLFKGFFLVSNLSQFRVHAVMYNVFRNKTPRQHAHQG